MRLGRPSDVDDMVGRGRGYVASPTSFIQQAMRSLLVWILITAAAAAIASAGSRSARTLYPALVRPTWAPPAWLFAPAWTVLYLGMAVAGWLVWRERGTQSVTGPIVLFGIQLVLNALWSWLFFAWRRGGLAFAECVVFALAVLATLIVFWRVRPLAGVLFLPYLAWVTFATALTYAVWQANPDRL